ncbi:MAG: PAS domain S-box protein [Cyanobacteria bacterium]|nr:PAS domain S-box protein [Cyanobacteriota bacterium]MDA0867420.1 PAS domain S-box protein [Cyanobacteriota bacterium]
MDPDSTRYQKKITDLEAENQLLRQQLLTAQQTGQPTLQALNDLPAGEASRHRPDPQGTEARLHQQAAQYQQIFETITDGLGIINLETGELVEVNPAYHQMHGYTYDEFMAVPLAHHVHPDSLPLLAQFVEAIRAGRTFAYNAQNVHRQGHGIDIEVKGIPYPYNGVTHGLAIVRNVSDRNRMAANLRLSEARLIAAFEQAAVGFAESDMQTGRLTLVNTRFCEMTGYSQAELAAMTIADLTHPEDVATSKQAIQLLFSGQIEHFTLEKRYLCKGGGFFWSETTVYLVEPPDQQATYCMAAIQNINQRKRLEAERKAAEKALKLTQFAVENAATSLFWISDSGQIQNINQSACKTLGYTAEELKTKFVWDIRPSLSREQWPQHYQVLKEQSYLRFEAEYQTKNQAIFPVEITSNYLEYGEQGYIFAQVQDIRDRKASEDALKQSEEKFRTLVENMNGAVYRCKNDADWTMEFISDAIFNLSGYAATDLIQNQFRTYASLIHPDDANYVDTSVAKALANRQPFTLEYRILHRDGSSRWIYEKGKGIFDHDDQLLFIEGVFFDINDTKSTETENKAYQEKLEFLIQKTTLGIIEWDTDFQAVAWNPAAAQIFGYSADEMLGQHARRIVPLEFQPYVDDVMTALVEGQGGNYSINENTTKAGMRITCEWINTVLYDTQQETLGIFSLVQDITARTKAEADLKQSEASLRLQRMFEKSVLK